jgi:hypothetical protein
LGDGDCDSGASSWYSDFNCEALEYDGGDCCVTTCEPDSSWDCEEFECLDPEAPVPVIGESCPRYLGDGVFDCDVDCVAPPTESPVMIDCDTTPDPPDYHCEEFDWTAVECLPSDDEGDPET